LAGLLRPLTQWLQHCGRLWASLVRSSPLRQVRWLTGFIVRISSVENTSRFVRAFSSTQPQSKAVYKRRVTEDAYAKTQRLRHAAALKSRQRWEAATDPKQAIHGKPTPFLESFDAPTPLTNPQSSTSQPPLNFGLSPEQMQGQLTLSRFLLSPSKPLVISQNTSAREQDQNYGDVSMSEAAPTTVGDPRHSTATEAMRRITSLDLGRSKDRLNWNIKRCIETFGRHSTDSVLPKGTGRGLRATARIGKDTGSSEVQIAVLTAKIRNLSENLRNKDKMNKRQLRTFVHKRQKLLKYLHRRERGGPRWQNLVETLGLTEPTWKGQISI
jgi:ribosomal protein S15